MKQIRQLVHAMLAGRGPQTVLELGSYVGDDTAWMAAIPGVTMHCVEPDVRNVPPQWPNVTLYRKAIAAHDGRCEFILSTQRKGKPHTKSSSIRAPKHHLDKHPDVRFGDTVEVECVTLDTFTRGACLGEISFIWSDIQGAEGDMIRGGADTLARTRWLYTEYSNDEEYEGQPSLDEILCLLPDFRVAHKWPADVLLENWR